MTVTRYHRRWDRNRWVGLFVEAERIMVIAGDGRTTLPPDGPKRAFVAYSGPYTLDGTRYVCHVDSGSSPEMFIDQIRHVRFESPTRIVVHPLSRLLDRAAGLEFGSNGSARPVAATTHASRKPERQRFTPRLDFPKI